MALAVNEKILTFRGRLIDQMILKIVNNLESEEFKIVTGAIELVVYDSDWKDTCLNYQICKMLTPRENLKYRYSNDELNELNQSRTVIIDQHFNKRSMNYQINYDLLDTDFAAFPYLIDFFQMIIEYQINFGTISLEEMDVIANQIIEANQTKRILKNSEE